MLMPSPHHEAHDSYISNYLTTGEKKIIGSGREVVARKKDGALFHVRLAVGEMKLEGYHAFTGILHDLTELRTAEEDSLKDPATGLLNRRAFDKYLAAALSRSKTSLLFVDVDKLKSINDELGHLHGDEAINTAARTISGCLRSTDPGACARIGGDEFAVVLPRSDEEIAMLVATRILEVANPALKSIHPQAGVSIGVATASKDTPSRNLLGAADDALYRAKEKRGVVSC
ncbi:MAG: GGDEF domain-containing protein [Gammaproteobacteria bacterium]|nr:GGDEF domain-containing protein [Gammaproteobacteria bacterium]